MAAEIGNIGPCAGGGAKERGFSLVELLIIIAVVGLLMALLFPVFGMAEETARRTQCASNLRQIGVTLQTYAASHDGEYPLEDLCGNPQQHLISALVPDYVTEQHLFYCPSADDIEPYANSNEYGGPGGDSVIDTLENWNRHYITYKYFCVRRRDNRMPLPLNLSEYPHLLYTTSPPSRWLMSDWVRQGVPVFPHRQKGGWGGGRNVLFVDGSVQFVEHQTPGAFKDE